MFTVTLFLLKVHLQTEISQFVVCSYHGVEHPVQTSSLGHKVLLACRSKSISIVDSACPIEGRINHWISDDVKCVFHHLTNKIIAFKYLNVLDIQELLNLYCFNKHSYVQGFFSIFSSRVVNLTHP